MRARLGLPHRDPRASTQLVDLRLPIRRAASYTQPVQARLFLVMLLACVACGDDAPPEETTEIPETPEEPEPSRNGRAPEEDDDPLVGLDDPELIDDTPDGVAANAPADVPAMGCVAYGDQALRVWARPGIADIVSVGDDGFVVAGYAEGASGEEVFAVTVAPGRAPRPLLRELLERPLRSGRVAPPGLGAIDGGHVGIAITDLGARVLFDVIQLGGRRTGFGELASGADQRFSPMVAATQSTRVVAYTDGSDARTRVWALAVDGTNRVTTREDITPASSTGRGPLWLAPETIAFIDAREGTSTVWAQRLGPSGTPDGEAAVFATIANAYDPIQWALSPAAEGHVLTFTAVGRAAKTAVGLITTEDPTPAPVVPSEGYGSLQTDVVSSDTSLVFVADAPKGEARDAAREIRVRRAPLTNPRDLGEVLTLSGPDGSGHHARIARHGLDYALVFGSSEGVYVHFLRCDES